VIKIQRDLYRKEYAYASPIEYIEYKNKYAITQTKHKKMITKILLKVKNLSNIMKKIRDLIQPGDPLIIQNTLRDIENETITEIEIPTAKNIFKDPNVAYGVYTILYTRRRGVDVKDIAEVEFIDKNLTALGNEIDKSIEFAKYELKLAEIGISYDLDFEKRVIDNLTILQQLKNKYPLLTDHMEDIDIDKELATIQSKAGQRMKLEMRCAITLFDEDLNQSYDYIILILLLFKAEPRLLGKILSATTQKYGSIQRLLESIDDSIVNNKSVKGVGLKIRNIIIQYWKTEFLHPTIDIAHVLFIFNHNFQIETEKIWLDTEKTNNPSQWPYMVTEHDYAPEGGNITAFNIKTETEQGLPTFLIIKYMRIATESSKKDEFPKKILIPLDDIRWETKYVLRAVVFISPETYYIVFFCNNKWFKYDRLSVIPTTEITENIATVIENERNAFDMCLYSKN